MTSRELSFKLIEQEAGLGHRQIEHVILMFYRRIWENSLANEMETNEEISM